MTEHATVALTVKGLAGVPVPVTVTGMFPEDPPTTEHPQAPPQPQRASAITSQIRSSRHGSCQPLHPTRSYLGGSNGKVNSLSSRSFLIRLQALCAGRTFA